MSKDTEKNLLIVFSIPRLYQQLFAGIANYEALGSRIISRIKTAHAFRQVEQVRELSEILIDIPLKEYQLIAQYYLVWCKCRDYQYPAEVLENIIEQTQTYKTKALFSRAAMEVFQGNIEHAFKFYMEAFKTSPTVTEYIDLARSLAGLKALEGFHQSALKDLEDLIPIIKYSEPRLYYDFLNSYAVELGEMGHKQEARNISRAVLASPFAFAYPEWQETANDLRGSQRSFVGLNSSQHIPHNEAINNEPINSVPVSDVPLGNVLFMPMIEAGKSVARLHQPARILDLQKWKKKIGKRKKRNGEKPSEKLKAKEMLMRIMQFYVSSNTTAEQRRKIYEYALKVLSAPDTPKPD